MTGRNDDGWANDSGVDETEGAAVKSSEDEDARVRVRKRKGEGGGGGERERA